MGEAEMGSALKRMLKSLCCCNGWSYGVFWCFDKRNSMLLTLEDAYYDERMATVVGNMLLQVHLLGEGIIGEVAISGKHKWMFSDAHGGGWNSIARSPDVFQGDSDFHGQFSSGIQTIAVIPVESRGVLQFGSTQKMLENLEFLDQTRRLFQVMENFDGLIHLENMPQSLNNENYDLNAILASLMSPGSSFTQNLVPAHGGNSRELMGNRCSVADQSSSENDYGRICPLHINSSYNYNKPQTAGQEAQVLSPYNPDTQCQQVFLQSTCSVKNSVANMPCISTWSDEGSIWTSFEQPFLSESVIQESMFTSMYGTEGLDDKEKTFTVSTGEMMDNQHSSQLFLETEGELPGIANNLPRLTEEFKLSDFATDLSSSHAVDDISQWFTPSPNHSFHRMETNICNNLLLSGGAPVSYAMVDGDVTMVNPIKHPSISVQSSTTDAFLVNGQSNFEVVHSVENDLFDGLGLNSGCARTDIGECWEDYIKPAVIVDHPAISSHMSECITELDVGSAAGPRKGLFSELRLGELLHSSSNSSTITKCSLEDQFLSPKRRKVEKSSSISNQVQWTKLPCSAGSISLVQDVHNKQNRNNLVWKKDVLPKSQVGLWIDDSYNINTENAVAMSPRKPEKHTKVSKKRARPGESTRPRPKDRQQIQDRLKELRDIIPNGAKCSIDCLLDLTIKHMLFLKSITQCADKIKEAEEPKLIDKENGVVLKDNSTGGHNGSGCATWACEVEGPTLSCPIIVQDLSTPCQMLIEMLCEDRGFFLEIADMIRRFGLNIWKGVMERREDKIWARFIVEKNKNVEHVTRLDIIWSLVQLLQQTNMSGIDSMNQPNNTMDDRIPLLDGYQQPLLPIS